MINIIYNRKSNNKQYQTFDDNVKNDNNSINEITLKLFSSSNIKNK